jgi:uncharacterized protein YndB with AHSA1/START domain
MSSPLPRPDLSSRPYGLTVERVIGASPQALYRAWTEEFDGWFATPGMIRMRPAVDEPFVFLAGPEGNLHPHHGRFLALEPDRRVELTWVSGAGGTEGAETVLTVDLEPAAGNGTLLRLHHTGFYDAAAAERHEQAWGDHVLPQLDAALASATDS